MVYPPSTLATLDTPAPPTTEMIVAVSIVSTSVSLASRSLAPDVPLVATVAAGPTSSMSIVSATAVIGSLTPVIVMLMRAVSVPPFPSLTSYSKVSIACSPSASRLKNALGDVRSYWTDPFCCTVTVAPKSVTMAPGEMSTGELWTAVPSPSSSAMSETDTIVSGSFSGSVSLSSALPGWPKIALKVIEEPSVVATVSSVGVGLSFCGVIVTETVSMFESPPSPSDSDTSMLRDRPAPVGLSSLVA